MTSLCRGGFFPSQSPSIRRRAIEDNLLAIDQAVELGAPMIVLVCGAEPGLPLSDARKHIADGISAILPHAKQAGVKLAIEPLHPMYAGDRSAINTIRQANNLCDQLGSPDLLGIVVDVYHVWWDDELEEQIKLTAHRGRLQAFHICDWLAQTTDLLNDRGLMGEGFLNIRQISDWVDATGFTGPREVEVFSNRWWSCDQQQYLDEIVKRYQQLYAEPQ